MDKNIRNPPTHLLKASNIKAMTETVEVHGLNPNND